ncbi:MAG: deoxyribose-phosphate aldolase [Myxococcales bacterium]|nr:deoxyribose-phosphate aldolase [Myxococcales bacterium]
MGQSPTPLNPTPKTPCKATGQECISCGWSVSRRPEDTRKIVKLGACRISSRPQVGAAVAPDIAGYIDHTLLKPETTLEQLDELCAEAAKYKFASVCINPVHIRYCKRRLQGSGVMVVTVVGFPLGATSTAAKVAETRRAVEDGADEIDMVINIGLLKSTAYRDVEEDIRRVVKAAHPKPVKVIIETSKLSREEKVIASALSKAAGAHFVKTSTGFGGGGATAEDVALMKQVVGRDIEVKASGGVRSIDDAVKMLEAGATRLGASASVAIVSGKTVKSSGY